jgi:hypothetical protein
VEDEVKMETPFTGWLAVLGVRGKAGHFLSLRGQWTLSPGAVVYQPEIMSGTAHGRTVIGHILELHVWAGNLYCTGWGADWLHDLLHKQTHALSMDMVDSQVDGPDVAPVVVAGRVRAAMLVKADDFGWIKKEKV